MAQSSKITTRNGAKLRTATRRRFVVITEAVKFDGTPDAWVTKRSDDLDTLRAFWRSRGTANRYIFDTVEGKEVT